MSRYLRMALLPLSFVVAAAPLLAFAADLPPDQDCKFVAWWANKAYHISHIIGLEEARWTIAEEGFLPEVYAVIVKIKHEAYHDVPALRKRVKTACSEKVGT